MRDASAAPSWWWLGGLWLALVAVQLPLRPLLPVDETRYLSVAWEMWQRGEFLVPFLNGEPYSHKPPLLFWLIQAGWALFGVNQWSARLLPPLLALLCLLLTWRLGRRLWPQRSDAASWAVWLLFGTGFWLLFMTLVQFDLLVTLFALLAFDGLLQAGRGARGAWWQVGIAIGLGVLGKGPVVLVAVLPPALLAPWWVSDGRRVRWRRWYTGVVAALALGVIISLAWAIPAGVAGGTSYREAIFWGQSAGRVLDSFAHRSPWWTYVAVLPLMWLPWIAWPPFWRALRRLPALGRDSGIRFCLAGLLPALLIFSLISGKQGKYLLPVMPLLALLLGRLLVEIDSGRWRRSARVLLFATASVIGVAHLTLVPAVGEAWHIEALSRRIGALQRSGVEVANLGKYHGQYHFLGRLDQPISVLPYDVRARQWLTSEPQAYVLVYYHGRMPVLPDGVYHQPYRSGTVALWPVKRLLDDIRRLDALLGNA